MELSGCAVPFSLLIELLANFVRSFFSFYLCEREADAGKDLIIFFSLKIGATRTTKRAELTGLQPRTRACKSDKRVRSVEQGRHTFEFRLRIPDLLVSSKQGLMFQ